jgi:catechol 2,3-dioxygenase-like lactoylglutathione lyase family enzyme
MSGGETSPAAGSRFSIRETIMIKPRRVGHTTFETTDLDKQIAYWTDIAGLVLAEREKNRAFLATKTGLLVVALEQTDQAACTRLSFEVAPGSDFGELAKNLAADGIKSELRNDSIPGMGKVLSFKDNKGTAIDLFTEWKYLGSHHQVHGIGPLKLGHIAFAVPDVKAVADFYAKVMGFRVSDWIDDWFVFMRCNSDHHTVNFIKGENTEIHHLAFELKDMSHMQNACEMFATKKVKLLWGPVRHGPGHNVATYHRNPDDHTVELYIELDQMKDEELGYFDPRPWHRDTPQYPKTWSRHESTIWGLPPLPEYRRERHHQPVVGTGL